jgi:NAD-dependent oxidoreductase involved in siderophore biosynthesis
MLFAALAAASALPAPDLEGAVAVPSSLASAAELSARAPDVRSHAQIQFVALLTHSSSGL